MSAGLVHVQAKAPNGRLVFDSTVESMNHNKVLLNSAMLALDEFIGVATIRSQVAGTGSWSYYCYECRSYHCYADHSLSW